MPWEETENQIRHRIRPPEDFQAETFRTVTIQKDKPRVECVMGRLKGEDTMTPQSLLFPKDDGWTMADAKAWWEAHKDGFRAVPQTGGTSVERRTLDLSRVELRIDSEADRPRISGHGAVFNAWSQPIGGAFRERILPGAFSKTLRESPDIFSLFNHNPDNVLGRTLNGTLELREDDKGLWFRATPPENDPLAASVLAKIEGGYITGNSFAFAVIKDTWGAEEIDGQSWQTRKISELRLFEVGPVTFPAYEETDVAVRELVEWDQRVGRRLQGKRLDQLAKIAQDLTDFIAWARSEEGTAGGGDENNSASSRSGLGHSAASERERLRRRLDARIRAA